MTQKDTTYDFDANSIQEFTVQFFGGHVRIDDAVLPLGQISTEILNLPEEKSRALHKASSAFGEFLTGRLAAPGTSVNLKLAHELQRLANEVQGVLFTIPPYSYMNLDVDLARTVFPQWYNSDPKQFRSAFQRGTLTHTAMTNFFDSIMHAFPDIMEFQGKVNAMLEVYFEPLHRRSPALYARAVHEYLQDGETLESHDDELIRDRDVFMLQQTRSTMVEYASTEVPGEVGEYVITERMVFHRMAEFLHMDLFRALIHGNAPRRCHNCGKYFLLTQGYNTCYCNNIAPGETERTCRKVGAHLKEKAEKGKSPIRVEYDRVYRRLTTRKNRGSISAAQWNEAVAKAQEFKDRADKGELSELELRELYGMM